MSNASTYTYCISHGPFSSILFRLNDIPFYRICDTTKETGVTETNVADHLLVRGENTFTFEIHESDEKYFATFELQLDHDRKNNLFEFAWPHIYQFIPAVTSLPFKYTLSFNIPDLPFRSAFLDAEPQSFGPEGNRELHEAVMRFYYALIRSDAKGFLHEMRLKVDELQRAYPGSPMFDYNKLEGTFIKRFEQGLEVETIRLDELVFESCAGGRVAYVTRKDGGRPISAHAPDGAGMIHDLWLTHYQGRWQIFR
jgi:hypothetical protein